MALFGSRIKRLRTEHGHTQDELAKLVGVSRSTISMVERNERRPDDELLETIADIYNVDMDYLYGRQEVENLHRLVSETSISLYWLTENYLRKPAFSSIILYYRKIALNFSGSLKASIKARSFSCSVIFLPPNTCSVLIITR